MAEHTLNLTQSENLEFADVNEQDNEAADGDPDVYFDAGECPWCDADGFSRPKMHARQAHPDEWAAYDGG